MYYPKKITKRAYVLLEVLISCALFGMILTALFFWMHASQVVGQRVEKERKQIESIECCQLLLKRLLQSASLSRSGDFFFTKSDSQDPILFFTCSNEVDPDPHFSNEVLIALWRDNNNRLIITMWPAPHRPEFDENLQRHLVLLEGVTSLSWNFLVSTVDAVAKARSSAPSTESEPVMGTWVTEWSSDKKRLPLAVVLNLELANMGTYNLSYPLLSTAQPLPVEH